MAVGNQYKDRNFIAVIEDEDTITGLLLARVGHVDSRQKSNFLVVDAKTTLANIGKAFLEYTHRKDIAINIRELIGNHDRAFPAVLDIPSKDQPYDPSKVSVLKRVQRLFGE
ncbi:V-type ATPase [Basidiobolus meristosporus CBS 931.73]|uniref:V-type proton ATPase subunit F n=1 Tax=Basidiobolus meristosporus CBS 931.73 TaxID=1314790 RepID=A0A1Y1Y999_9FUNG|nr:V-type ATPase [Basidiobolus meristosporus CBS 931.73]|eukprot:ORX94558.1 V-type ATPase [Basidiobolus meristosporus CBS 931.73]